MKKFLLPALAALFATSGALADQTTMITTPSLAIQTGGMMGLGMSDNGRYISGSCFGGEAFVYDRVDKKIVTTGDFAQSVQDVTGTNQCWTVTNEGLAYGWDGLGGIALGINGTYDLFYPIPASFDGVCPYSTTADGSIVAGYVMMDFTLIRPCYWENGEVHFLSFSSTAEAGFPVNKGAKATHISSDGRIIMGNLENRSSYNPMVFWVRQDDGTYKYVPAFLPYYQDVFNADGSYKDAYKVGPLTRFMPMAMTPDGSKIALLVQETEGWNGKLSPFELAIYDTATETYEIIPYKSSNLLYSNSEFLVTAMSNNGYITGVAGSTTAGPIPFVMAPDKYDSAMTLSQAFPDSELLEEWSMEVQGFGTYITTAMSEDASYIVGYMDVVDESLQTVYYGTFCIETGFNDPIENPGETGVNAIEEAASDAPATFYTVDGRPVSNPQRGLYIKVEGGKASKVIL